MPDQDDVARYLEQVVDRALDDELPQRRTMPRPPRDELAPPPPQTWRGRTRHLLRRVYTPVAREEILLVQQVDARLNTEWARIDTALTGIELAIDRLRDEVAAASAGGDVHGPASPAADRVAAALLRAQSRERAPRLPRYTAAVPVSSRPAPVLVLGADDTEWLAALRAAGAEPTVADPNPELVVECQALGFDAVVHHPIELLDAAPMQSYAAISALSLVDTLELPALVDLVDHAFHALRPGGALLLEAPEPTAAATPATLAADPRHRRPLHPDVPVAAALEAGFTAEVWHFDAGSAEPTASPDAAATYAVVARRPDTT